VISPLVLIGGFEVWEYRLRSLLEGIVVYCNNDELAASSATPTAGSHAGFHELSEI